MKTEIIQPATMRMVFNKSDNDEKYLLLGIIRLDKKEIDEVIINQYTFQRTALEKKNGKLNMNLATYIFAWAYHSDIMHSLCNSDI